MMANPILDKISKLNAEIEQLREENSHLRRIGMNRPSAELHEAAIAELRDEITNLRTEVLEQARLLDMGAEREAKLRARNAVLEEVVRFYADIHTWKSASVFMCGHDGNSRATIDRGEKARGALKDTTS
jgi:chromosome segregation ATPase